MKNKNNLFPSIRYSRTGIYPLAIMGMFLLFANSCSKDDDNNNTPTRSVPVLTTSAVSNIKSSTANSGGSINSDGGSAITARGICWSTGTTPTVNDNKTIDGTGTGSFVSTINDLNPNTTYYVRAYATNTAGTGYGNTLSFKTSIDQMPTLDFTSPATNTLQVDKGENVPFQFVAKSNLNSNSSLTNINIVAKYSAGGSDVVLDYDVPSSTDKQVTINQNYKVPTSNAYGTVITVTVKVTDKAGEFAEKSFSLTVTNILDINVYSNITLGAQAHLTLGSAYASDLNNVYTATDAKTNQSRIDFLYFYDDVGANAHTIAAPNDPVLATVTGLVSNWTTKNATTFKVVSGYTSTEYDALASSADIFQIWLLSGTPLSKAANLSQNSFIVFKTKNSKYGIIKIATINEATQKKTSSLNINVKVEK